MTDPEHVCRPGASLYYCPASGAAESDCHGGFGTCCDQPDRHQPLLLTGEHVLDRRRRYLVPVGRLLLPSEPKVVHLTVYWWHERSKAWMIGQALCARSVEGEPILDGTLASCPDCAVYLPKYVEALAREVALLLRQDAAAAPGGAQDRLWVQVRTVLETSRLSQAEAARRLGLSTKHLCRMLTGQSQMSLDWAEQILGLCGMELTVRVRPSRGKAKTSA